MEIYIVAGRVKDLSQGIYKYRPHEKATLKDISNHFGIGESGVSRASRRVAQKIEKDKKLKRKIYKIEKK